MKRQLTIHFVMFVFPLFLLWGCNQKQKATVKTTANQASLTTASYYGGFKSQIQWGEHLVTIGGCNDCHTPKKMTAMGLVPDMTRLLSGHPANVTPPKVDRKEIEKEGLAVTNDLTVWIGPWGISYAANLTPDPTGIGNWNEEQFARALREGKFMGQENGRTLLPPMPWQNLSHLTDDETKAIFAYLKSIKPIHNLIPPPVPPVAIAKQ